MAARDIYQDYKEKSTKPAKEKQITHDIKKAQPYCISHEPDNNLKLKIMSTNVFPLEINNNGTRHETRGSYSKLI